MRSCVVVIGLAFVACTAEVAPTSEPARATEPAVPERDRSPAAPPSTGQAADPPADRVDLGGGDVAPAPSCPVELPFMCATSGGRFECRARPCPASCERTGCPASFVCADCGSGPACMPKPCS